MPLGYFIQDTLHIPISYKTARRLNVVTLRPIIQGIKNFWRWRKVIWKDRQWDHVYMYDILIHKFKLMEEFFDSDETHIRDAKKVSKKIRTTRCLLSRIRKEDYSLPEYSKLLSNLYLESFTRKRDITVKEKKLMDYNNFHEKYMEEQDWDLFCKMMKKYSKTWWD